MSFLANLSPGQHEALIYGGAAVAGIVVITKLRHPAAAPVAATPVTPDPTLAAGVIPAGSTDAIGTGQLSSYFDTLTQDLGTITSGISNLENQPVATPPGPVKQPLDDPQRWEPVQRGDTLTTVSNRIRTRITQVRHNGHLYDISPNYLLYVNPRFAHIGVNGKLPAGEAVGY